MHPGRMVPLATAPNHFAAQVIAARLGSEGIVCELRGASGAYPVGEVQVLVEVDAVDVAREILFVEEVEAAFDVDDDDTAAPAPPASLWLVLGVTVLVVVFSLARMVG